MRRNKLMARIAGFRRHESGSVLLMFALALIPLFALVGAAIDYGTEIRDASLLGTAADAAALAAISPSSPAFQKATGHQGNFKIKVNSAPYVSLLEANIGDRPEMTITGADVSITKNGLFVTATVTASATVQTSIMGMFGFKGMAVSKTSTASTNLPAYMDFHMLLDNSPSMGIGATTADINNLISLTSNIPNNPNEASCGFACHVITQDSNNPTTDYYLLARQNNVTLRIDLLRLATQNLMNVATSAEKQDGINNQFRFAVYTFGPNSTVAQTTPVTNVAPLSSNLSQVASNTSAVDLMAVDHQNQYGDADTPYDGAFNLLNTLIPTPGDGSKNSSRQEVLFFVTDGVADENLNGARTMETINQSLCTALKNRGVQIAILYTTYQPLPTNAFYLNHIQPFQPDIGSKLQQCASPNFYAEVGVDGNVSNAMASLFDKILATSRLTH